MCSASSSYMYDIHSCVGEIFKPSTYFGDLRGILTMINFTTGVHRQICRFLWCIYHWFFYSSYIHRLQSYFHLFSRQRVLRVVLICTTSTHVLGKHSSQVHTSVTCYKPLIHIFTFLLGSGSMKKRGIGMCLQREATYVHNMFFFSSTLCSTSIWCFPSVHLAHSTLSNEVANLFYSSLKVRFVNWVVLASTLCPITLPC